MNFIEVNGTATRYDLQGDHGPVIVLIHEMGGQLENWDEVVPGLAGDYRVLRYDCRGAGLAEKIRGELSIETLSDDLLALLDAFDLRNPVTVAGCAVGAAVALAFAGRHGDRVAGVAALSPAIDMKPEDRPARLEMLDVVARDGMRAIVDAALGAGYPEPLRARDPERFRAFKARWLGNDPESFIATYRMLIDLDISADIRAISCPVLGVGGTLDSLRPPDYVQRVLAPIPGVEFTTIETGHHQPAATPEDIAAVLRDFMKRAASRAG